MEGFSYLVVGAGFAGCVCAERLAQAGRTVLLIDQRRQLGGNAYDEYDEHGILIHRYGAHIFHTNSQTVFDYLSRFTAWRFYEHRVLSSVNGWLVPIPINQTTLERFGGDESAARNALIEPYTRKQWGLAPAELSPAVFRRIQTRTNHDDRYFLDRYQAMPAHGYARLFANLTRHENIKILLGMSYQELQWTCSWSGMTSRRCDEDGTPLPATVVYTGPVDEFFDYHFGRLPYRSARFEFETLNRERYQPVGVVNYPNADVAFTRIAEFKHLTGQQHPQTTITREYPQSGGEPFWPIPTPASAELYAKYRALADRMPHVHFVGRLGRYQYLDMDQVVAQALVLAQKLIEEEV